MTKAAEFLANAERLIEESTGDIWTALDNEGAWPAGDDGLFRFSDGSTLEEADLADVR